MTPVLKGPWSQAQIDDFLRTADVPLRLACVGADGYPRVVSVWYAWDAGGLVCVSHRDSALVRLLRREPRVGFEVSPNDPPYHGVRGQGQATLVPLGDSELLASLLERYLGSQQSRVGQWLLARREEEMLIRLQPRRLFSWDYRQRMADVSAGRAPR